MQKNNNNSSIQNTKPSSHNRFVLKLYGNNNHEFISIDSDTSLSVSKTEFDTFEKKGKISQWKFELDRIYSEKDTFDELYENEIDNTDYLNSFLSESTFRNIIFIGDRIDSLSKQPFSDFIINCLKENITFNTLQSGVLLLISYYEIRPTTIIDYLSQDNEAKSLKLLQYPNDTYVENISQVPVNSLEQIQTLLTIGGSKRNELLQCNKLIQNENQSQSEIFTIKLITKAEHYCISKINFVMYQAYEVGLMREDESGMFNFKMFTKDNYAFFSGVNGLMNIRTSYILRYIRDVYVNGQNLFFCFVCCEYAYLLLLYNLLNNIKMRKLFVHNFDYDDNGNNCNGNSNSNNNNNSQDDNISNFSMNYNNISNDNKTESFLSASKENFDLNDTRMTCADSNRSSTMRRERELNIERLKKIENKKQVLKFFDYLDKLY